jgi:23S rRNA (uracil1939-C5)-methyltransferase
MPLASGALLALTVEKPAVGGRMIARADGQIVLVGGAIPGERVAARVVRVAKGVAYAETTTVEEPSPDRRMPAGDPLCGGCLYNHITYERQLEIKAAVIGDAFARIARIDLPGPVHVAPSVEDGYRMRARLHLRGGRVGFFREGSHELCDPRETRQLLPAACDALDRLAREVGASSHEGDELELSENIAASERSIAIGQRILVGDAYVYDALTIDHHVVAWRRHCLAFFQGNRYLIGALVSHVVTQIPQGARVIDLYAGTGLFSLPLSIARGARVIAVEGDHVAALDLAWNTKNLSGAGIEPVHRSVESFLAGPIDTPGAVIVDPPRTGMSRDALAGALRLHASQIVYVSCDVATLARDSRRIVDAGYAVSHAALFDMFPNTPHIEAVLTFTTR